MCDRCSTPPAIGGMVTHHCSLFTDRKLFSVSYFFDTKNQKFHFFPRLWKSSDELAAANNTANTETTGIYSLYRFFMIDC